MKTATDHEWQVKVEPGYFYLRFFRWDFERG